jgi:hypothetical protein
MLIYIQPEYCFQVPKHVPINYLKLYLIYVGFYLLLLYPLRMPCLKMYPYCVLCRHNGEDKPLGVQKDV